MPHCWERSLGSMILCCLVLLLVPSAKQWSPAAQPSGARTALTIGQEDELTPQVYLPLVMRPRPPLFVGMYTRWDGAGYIRGSVYYDVGSHITRDLQGMTDADTIRVHARQWYDPDPQRWGSETWDAYYSISTGYFKSSSIPPDPSWKWGFPWILPYDWKFIAGQSVIIGGQPFAVSGPHSGYTAFGRAVQYWQLTNTKKFLFHDGGDWKQYVHAGDVTLRYDAGTTRLLLHSNVLRRFYYQGKVTSDTVQYIENLTSTNAFSDLGGTSDRSELRATTPRRGCSTFGPDSNHISPEGRQDSALRSLREIGSSVPAKASPASGP